MSKDLRGAGMQMSQRFCRRMKYLKYLCSGGVWLNIGQDWKLRERVV